LNIFVYGNKLFKSEIKKLFLKRDIEANIEYLNSVNELKKRLENKTQDDFFIVDENYIYDSNSFVYSVLFKIKKIKGFFQNKIDKKYLKTNDQLCFETVESIIEYILKISKNIKNEEKEIDIVENDKDIEENIEEVQKKVPEEITEIDEIEEDMLEEFITKD